MSKYRVPLDEMPREDLIAGYDVKGWLADHYDTIREALTRMAEIEEGKSVVVPVEPTQSMIDAACQLGWIRQLYEGKPQWLSPGIGVRMNKAYKAMIAAREGK